MATVEWYEGAGACPGCGDLHHVADQTKLFAPFGVSSTYRVGVEQRTEIDPGVFTDRIVEDHWWRLREPVVPPQLHVLHDLWDIAHCDCGLQLVAVLQFEVVLPDRVTLAAIQMLDIRDPALASSIDLVGDDEHGWYAIVSLAELTASPFEDRAAMLRELLAARFADLTDQEFPGDTTLLVGLVQCEACGLSRERRVDTHLTLPASARPPLSFFGRTWTGGTIYLGDRVPLGLASDYDADRTALGYTRLRDGDPAGLAILGAEAMHGCRCGAGRGSVVQRFARRGDTLELVELTMRVVTTVQDLADVDFSERTWRSQYMRAGLLREIAGR
ncbi:MAG: hypothetical protein ABI867_26330 [Kofleriaceae bacterium]